MTADPIGRCRDVPGVINDPSDEFVTKRYCRYRVGHRRLVLDKVDIRAAYPTGQRLIENLPRVRLRIGDLCDTDGTATGHYCAHCYYPTVSRSALTSSSSSRLPQ